MKQSTKRLLIVGGCVFLLWIAVVAAVFIEGTGACGKETETIVFTIVQGQSTTSVLKDLEQEGLIHNAMIAKIYMKMHGEYKIQAGNYTLNKGMNLEEILQSFSLGIIKGNEIMVTFIEGKRVTDYAEVIAKNFDYTKEEVIANLNDREYVKELIEEYWFLTDAILNEEIYYPLEGYLYPETYSFRKDASIKEIVKVLLNEMNKVLTPYKEGIEASSLSIHEIVTLASMVELEGASSTDRSIVAGVFMNRIKGGWTLGSDVTTYYAFQESMQKELTQAQYDTCNPYNTRSTCFTGLPVGPIGSASLVSLKAAINPAETDCYYFVADKNKNTYCQKTYQEFQNKINELKRNGLWYTY